MKEPLAEGAVVELLPNWNDVAFDEVASFVCPNGWNPDPAVVGAVTEEELVPNEKDVVPVDGTAAATFAVAEEGLGAPKVKVGVALGTEGAVVVVVEEDVAPKLKLGTDGDERLGVPDDD